MVGSCFVILKWRLYFGKSLHWSLLQLFNTSSTFTRVESKSAAVCLADKTFEMLEIIRIACGLQLLSLKRCFNKMLSILMHHIYFFDSCCPVSRWLERIFICHPTGCYKIVFSTMTVAVVLVLTLVQNEKIDSGCSLFVCKGEIFLIRKKYWVEFRKKLCSAVCKTFHPTEKNHTSLKQEEYINGAIYCPSLHSLTSAISASQTPTTPFWWVSWVKLNSKFLIWLI